jgi:predicted membrane channel-forming protein YqfA (hemolysin III family)
VRAALRKGQSQSCQPPFGVGANGHTVAGAARGGKTRDDVRVPNDESNEEKLDRELIELLNELRVALPGVQVLFAFLLGVPFTQRFEDVSDLQKDAYFFTFLCAAAATALLIAPSAYHRLTWRQHDKEHLLRVSNRLAISGTFLLAVAIASTVFVVTDLLFDTTSAGIIAGLTAGFYAWFWYGLPLLRRGVRD